MRRFSFGLIIALLIHASALPQYTRGATPARRSAALAGLQISASLDKAVYVFPDTILLTIQGTNTTNEPMVLIFGGCQISHLFDGAAPNQVCVAVITTVTIPAQSTHSWTVTLDAAPVGEHTITGMIVGYGMAAPLTVSIQGYRINFMYVAN